MHLYNNDIDISKSMKEHSICWANTKGAIYIRDKDAIRKHIKKNLILCKHKVTRCLDKMENNNEDIEQDIRACVNHIERAFYFVSR